MTKKGYIKFAKMMKSRKPSSQYSGALLNWHNIRQGMLCLFKEDNPRFDEDRFNAACGCN